MAKPETKGPEGVLVVTPGRAGSGLLWHPLPLAPGPDGAEPDPGEWVATILTGLTYNEVASARWAIAPRPSPGWTPPDPSWGESVPGACTP